MCTWGGVGEGGELGKEGKEEGGDSGGENVCVWGWVGGEDSFIS